MSKATEFDQRIARRIKQLRTTNGDASMAKLARFLGITYQSYQALERGEVSFRVSTLSKIATFFNTTVDSILGDEPHPEVPNIGQIAYVVDAMSQLPLHKAQELLALATSMLRESRNGSN